MILSYFRVTKNNSIINIPAKRSRADHQIKTPSPCIINNPVKKTANKIPCLKHKFKLSKAFSVFVIFFLILKRTRLKIPLKEKKKIKKNKAFPGIPDESGSI